MRWPAVRRAATAGVGLLLLAACSSGDEPKAQPRGATVPTAAPTTTTTNPYAVPPVIDAAYVNRVLAGLDAANGEIYRIVIATRTITPDMVDRVRALAANPTQAQLALDVLQEAGRRGFSNYLSNPGNDRTIVSELISATSQCVFARVDRDYSAVVKTTNPRVRNQWVALRRLDPSTSGLEYNPTGWGYIYNGVEANLQAPTRNPCEST